MNKILVVDDEFPIRESFTLILGGIYQVITAASGEGALKIITDQKIDLVFLDIRMPGLDGFETLKRIKEIDPELDVVMVTAVNDMQKAGGAIVLGASDYLVKPFNVDTVLKTAETLLRRRELAAKGTSLQKEARKRTAKLVGQSEKIVEIIKTVEKTAARSSRFLILGEIGTEKEVLASLIHEKGPHSNFPLRTLNLSETMSAAEIRARLLGAGKGSTTVALEKITGLFEEVGGGTLFINHIEHLSAEVLSSTPARACLIGGSCLTNLAERAKDAFGLFSEVLLTLPPLRKRISDLPLLLNHYLEKFGEKYGREAISLSPEVEEIFSNYPWPGNTLELECLIERLVITAPGEQITVADLPVDLLIKYPAGSAGSECFADFEKKYIRRIFEEVGQNKEKLAAVLKVNPVLLEGKI